MASSFRAVLTVDDEARQTTPLVSVIIPAFNAGRTLEESVRSALVQTYTNIELIIVDDGSTDNSRDIAERLATQDARIRVVAAAHRGVSAARNAGIAQARGEWLAPLDADDIWHPEKIARQIAVALGAEHVPGFVYCWVRRIDGAGQLTGSLPPFTISGFALHRLVLHNFVGTGSGPLFLRSAVVEAGGYDEEVSYGEDFLLQVRVAEHHPVEVAQSYLVGYRVTPGSLSSNREAMLSGAASVSASLKDSLPQVPRFVHRWNLARRLLNHAETKAYLRDRRGLTSLLTASVLMDPVGTLAEAVGRFGAYVGRRLAGPGAAPLPRPHFYGCDLQSAIAISAWEIRSHGRLSLWVERRRMKRLIRLDHGRAQPAATKS